jgi:hypothetical protein
MSPPYGDVLEEDPVLLRHAVESPDAHHYPGRDPSPAVEIAACYVVAEALTSTAKHAYASIVAGTRRNLYRFCAVQRDPCSWSCGDDRRRPQRQI